MGGLGRDFSLVEGFPFGLPASVKRGSLRVATLKAEVGRAEQEDGPMEEFLAVGTTPSGDQRYLSELSGRTLQENGLQGDTSGLYLYEASDDPKSFGIRVLASVPCLDAGFRMLDLLGLRLTPA